MKRLPCVLRIIFITRQIGDTLALFSCMCSDSITEILLDKSD